MKVYRKLSAPLKTGGKLLHICFSKKVEFLLLTTTFLYESIKSSINKTLSTYSRTFETSNTITYLFLQLSGTLSLKGIPTSLTITSTKLLSDTKIGHLKRATRINVMSQLKKQ